MAYLLAKTDLETYSIEEQLEQDGQTPCDGIRNAQAVHFSTTSVPDSFVLWLQRKEAL
jgi:predicted RNA-binding protein with PUA-like domain